MKMRASFPALLAAGALVGAGLAWQGGIAGQLDRSVPGLRAGQTLWDPPLDAVHIDPSQPDGAAEDGSREHPFNSMSDIRWKDGTVYVLKRGTTLTCEAFGLGGEGIVLASYGTGGRPVIRCTSAAVPGRNQHVLRVDSGQRLSVRDLEIVAPRATCCLRLGPGCGDVQVINCLFRGSAWGLRAFGFSGLKVMNTEIREIKDDGMFIQGVTKIEVATCYVHKVNQNWVPPYTSQKKAGGDAIQFFNCDDWHVHHNVLDRTNSGNKFCFIANNPGQKRGLFEHNLTRGPLTTGDGGASVYFHDGDGLVVRYNTILGPSPGALYSHTPNLRIYGNIVARTSGGVMASHSAHLAHNVFYQVDGPLVTGGEITVVNNVAELAEGVDGAFGKVRKLTEHHNLIMKPGEFARESLFADPEKLDFRPRPGSRCVNAGCETGITCDRNGVVIPQGTAPDIGAFERVER